MAFPLGFWFFGAGTTKSPLPAQNPALPNPTCAKEIPQVLSVLSDAHWHEGV